QDVIDTLAILLMFAVRIGLPIVLTLAVGVWLEKKLAPRERATRPARTARSAKIIQIHCWDIKKCASATRAQCAAAQHPELPCWLALQVDGNKVRPECYACAFYKPERIAA
ncbi:MAG: hypothetical protein L0Y55_10600, partial [Anaerolineales bacterium]|nr:hypothetical protein [Anaerolineales bacterium]